MFELQPAVGALNVVNRTGLSALELGVQIIINGSAETYSAQESAIEVILALGIGARLLEINSDGLILPDRGNRPGRLFSMFVAGNPIFAVETAYGYADEAAIANQGNPERTARRLAVGVFDRSKGFLALFGTAAFSLFLLAEHSRFNVAGNLDIIGRAIEIIGIECDFFAAEVRPDCRISVAYCRVGSQRDSAADRVFQRLLDKAGIDHIDQTAGCTTAVQQSRRSPDDLNTFRKQSLNRRLVVFTQRRRVEGIQAIGKNTDALTKLAANYRPRRHRSEITGAEARLL